MSAFAFIRPETARNILLIAIGGCYVGYHVAEWILRRRKRGRGSTHSSDTRTGAIAAKASARGVACASARPARPVSPSDKNSIREPESIPPPDAKPEQPVEVSAEELYRKARAIPHQPIPDPISDGEYLNLIGKSAELDYAPAQSKLGQYAMRRGAWVEAYYWMTLARRNGMHNLSPVMREIRTNWSMEGFQDQEANIHELFTVEAGSIGRALLHLDSGHEAAKAREFLKKHHPEFL